MEVSGTRAGVACLRAAGAASTRVSTSEPPACSSAPAAPRSRHRGGPARDPRRRDIGSCQGPPRTVPPSPTPGQVVLPARGQVSQGHGHTRPRERRVQGSGIHAGTRGPGRGEGTRARGRPKEGCHSAWKGPGGPRNSAVSGAQVSPGGALPVGRCRGASPAPPAPLPRSLRSPGHSPQPTRRSSVLPSRALPSSPHSSVLFQGSYSTTEGSPIAPALHCPCALSLLTCPPPVLAAPSPPGSWL